MTVREATIARIQQMPEPLLQDVQDYIDFLLTRGSRLRRQAAQHSLEMKTLGESDMSDYLPNLEDYEERLARGEIKW